MALCRFIYGVIKKNLCNERLVYVHYVAIDAFNSDYYSIEKTIIAALWSCSGKPGASLSGQRCRRFAAAEPLHG